MDCGDVKEHARLDRPPPARVEEATWSDILVRYGSTPHRLRLLAGLHAALASLRQAGCTRAYLDGSFVTAKEETYHDYE